MKAVLCKAFGSPDTLVVKGKVRPSIGSRLALEEAARALAHLAQRKGKGKGKTVLIPDRRALA